MSRAFESFCGVGRPCPNFQRLIEYVEPVAEEEGAAGDGLQSGEDLRRKTARNSTQASSNAIIERNQQTSSLKISRSTTLHRFPHTQSGTNFSLNRRPKFMDIRSLPGESSAKMNKKLGSPAGVPVKNTAQQRKWESKQPGAKPRVKINEMTKKLEIQAAVPQRNIAQQRKWEPRLGAAKPSAKINEMTKKLENPPKDPVKAIVQQRKLEPKQLRAKLNVKISPNKANPTSTVLNAQPDKRMQQIVELENRRKTPRKQ